MAANISIQGFNLFSPSTWVPVFGNYCGPGWTGGVRVADGETAKFDVDVVETNGQPSQVDTACYDHDLAYAAATVSLPQRAYLQLTDASGSVTGSQTFTQSAPDANTRVSRSIIRNAAGQITSDGTVTTSLSNNRLSAVVDTQLGGHNVRVLYSEDSHGDLVASKLVSYDGKTPANASGFPGALTTQKISPWDLAANHPGEAPAALGDASGNPMEPTPENLFKANDPAKPGTGDTLQNSLTSISEVLGREWLHTNSAKGTVWRIAA